MPSFADRFAAQSTDIRRKAGILRVVLLVVLSLLPLIFILDFITKDYANAVLEGSVFIFMLIAFILLQKGHYHASALAAVIAASLVLSAMALVADDPQPALLFRNVSYFVIAISFSLLFIQNRKIPVLIATVGGVIQVVFVFIRLRPTGLSLADSIPTLISALAVLFLISFLILKASALSRLLNLEIEHERQRADHQLDRMSRVIAGTTTNLEAMGNLTTRVEEIRRLVADAGRSIESIEERVRSMENTSNASISATDRIGDRIGELNQSIEEEFAAQVESAASINEMVASIRSVADSANRRRASMEALAGTTDSGMQRLDSLLSYIARIEGSIGSIQNMVKVINNIAGSTNLLSMNASIEAAHAGDAGRGFSVVAEEIRKLADTSGKNAKEIGRQLKEVIPIITNAAEESGHTKKSFESIRQEIDRAIEAFQEITSATEELADGGKQILEALRTLGEMSERVKSGGSEIQEAQTTVESHLQDSLQALQSLRQEAGTVRQKDEAILDAVQEVSTIGEQGVRNAEALHNMTRGEDNA